MRRITQFLIIALFTTLAAILIYTAMPFYLDPVDDGFDAFPNGNHELPFELISDSAEQGNAIAQYSLGVLYDIGNGVPQDFTEATKWYRLAADQGNASAQAGLGWLYRTGNSVPQDYTEAAKWYGLAARRGVAPAQFSLGMAYDAGNGVPQDYILAHMWTNLATTNGYENGSSYRDIIATKLSPADLSVANLMANVCHSSNYEACGY